MEVRPSLGNDACTQRRAKNRDPRYICARVSFSFILYPDDGACAVQRMRVIP